MQTGPNQLDKEGLYIPISIDIKALCQPGFRLTGFYFTYRFSVVF